MNRNDYRRALIMLRSLKGGASGYVRLERRTLAGTLQFTLNSAPTGAELYAVLLYRKNGTWNAVKADAFGAPRYGQVGMVWSFDPRNIAGRTLEQYDLAAVVEKRGSVCEPILCGNLNGSVDADFSQIRAAVCRLFTPVRVSAVPVPSIAERTAPQSTAVDTIEIPPIGLHTEKLTASSTENSDSSPGKSESQLLMKNESTEYGESSSVPSDHLQAESEAAVSGSPGDSAADTVQFAAEKFLENSSPSLISCPCEAEKDHSAPEASARLTETDDSLPSAPDDENAASPAPADAAPIPDSSEKSTELYDCQSPADSDRASAQAVLSRSIYPAQKDASSPSAAVNKTASSPDTAAIEPDEFDIPAAAPIEPDDLDIPAETPIEPDEFDTPAVSTSSSKSEDYPASSDADKTAVQAVLSRGIYPAQKDTTSPPTNAAKKSISSPDAAAIEPDEFDMPAASPIESDDLDTPAEPPIELDAFDTPASAPIEPDVLDTPAAVSTSNNDSENCSASSDADRPTAQAVLSRSVYPAQKAFSPPSTAAVEKTVSPDAAAIESDAFDTPAASPIESDEFDTPAASPIESDDLDTPADSRFATPAKHPEAIQDSMQYDSSAQPTPAVQSPTAGEQLDLLDPDAAWHDSIEPLHRLFFSQEAVIPFESEGYVFIRAPLYDVENTSSCLIGLYCEGGVPSRVCYAIPSEYTPEPPAGLEGYVWRGSHTRGYWVICEGIPST